MARMRVVLSLEHEGVEWLEVCAVGVQPEDLMEVPDAVARLVQAKLQMLVVEPDVEAIVQARMLELSQKAAPEPAPKSGPDWLDEIANPELMSKETEVAIGNAVESAKRRRGRPRKADK